MNNTNINQLLEQNQNAELLRFTTAGSVDDGKSTLIGRLLHDSKSIYEDHLENLDKDSKKLNREEIDYALLTDGLSSEREQGITIDVAYRYFSTPKRRFIIADTPGHEQYTRNMATGASTADVAIILIDARHGVLTQSKRHAFISSLLGIPHVLVAINKMDLVEYSKERFDEIKKEFSNFSTKLSFRDIHYAPISALCGDNIVNRSKNMDWYDGTTLIHYLESVEISGDRNLIDFRFPVQYVNRPNLDFRGFCGTIASGLVKTGDEIIVLPSGKTSKIKEIVTFDDKLDYAFASQSVTLTLEDEVDISRGDMLVHPNNIPNTESDLEAMIIWMSEESLALNRPYLIKQTTQTVRGTIAELKYKIDLNELHKGSNEELKLNEIGRVNINLFKPLMVDDYSRNRNTGSFIVIDPLNNKTVACGTVIERSKHKVRAYHPDATSPVSKNITKERGYVTKEDREKFTGTVASTLWFTGLSGSGKSTIAQLLEKQLIEEGILCYILDGDNIRHGLNSNLGFSAADRSENIRRVAEVAKLMNDAGVTVITSFIAPYRIDRENARKIIGEGFTEVFINAPLEECEKRDPKGLYRKARAGEIPEFTGISAPYEQPENPEINIETHKLSPEDACQKIMRKIKL